MTKEEMIQALRNATMTVNTIMQLAKCDPDPREVVREANTNLIEHCEIALDVISDLADAVNRVSESKTENRKVA